MTQTRAFVLLLSALAITQNSFAMDPMSPEFTGHINKAEKLDPELLEVGRLGHMISVELPTQAERAEILSSYIFQKFSDPQYNYAVWARESQALWPHMLRPVIHSTDGYSHINLIELIDNIFVTARRNNCFNVRFIYDALEQMDLKVRPWVAEALVKEAQKARKARSRN